MNAPEELIRYLAAAQNAARQAGGLLKAQVGGPRMISFKGQIDMVTEMDRRSERIVVEALLAAFPDHAVLAEEETRIEGGSGHRWIIDPLDGTTNYAHGYPHFAVSIGLEHQGRMIVGVVYDPLRDELFSAIAGHGAFLNAKPIGVSTNGLLIRSLLATGFPYDRATSPKNNLAQFNTMIMRSQEVRRCGSAALDLCSVAAGRLDGYWELKLKPWDVAAGGLIVLEAGGTVTGLTGARFSIHGDSIVASNGLIHGQILDVLAQAGGGAAG
jgi:myo-inositol-1(or 4)-monophosphatase